ncbi:MAG TPA: AAA family ATPase [Micropepsaceae bacterium]|nr:AAA family ATPase [Micropepsaceae bacterium]
MAERSDRLDLIQRAAKRLRDTGAEIVAPPPPASDHAPVYDLLERNTAANRQEFIGPARSQEPVIPPLTETRPRPDAQPVDNSKSVRLRLGELRRKGMITPDNLKSKISFEFRAVKRKLLANARDQKSHALTKNLIMVTSALPGEGKTFTSMNLALALAAERDVRVLLIDGDVIHPSLGALFEPVDPKGLTDLLNGNCNHVDEVMHVCSNLPNLNVVFSGPRDERAPELMSSRRMVDICLEISTRYNNRIVIFDTPPVLASSETANLAMHVHQTIMVVSAGQANRSQLQTALENLSTCQNISLVFNKAPKWYKADSDSYYYYGLERPAENDGGRA